MTDDLPDCFNSGKGLRWLVVNNYRVTPRGIVRGFPGGECLTCLARFATEAANSDSAPLFGREIPAQEPPK